MGSGGSTRVELNLEKTRVDPRGFGIYEACRLGRGRVDYTRVCKCWLLLVNNDDPAIDQALNGIPESEVVARRVPGDPIETTELICIMPPRRGIR